MITARLAFAAVAVIRDADSNSITAFNILEGIVPGGLPVFLQQVAFFVLWDRSADDPARVAGTFTAELERDALSEVRFNVDFGVNLSHRTIMKANGLVIPRPGTLRFRIVLETGSSAEYFLRVEAPAPVAQPA